MRVLVVFRRLIAMPEFWSAMGALTWSGWVLLQPVPLYDRVPYHVLTGAISDPHLVLISLLIGICQLLAVIRNKRWPRAAMAFAACVLWLSLGNGLWLGERSSPSVTMYLVTGVQEAAMMLLLCCPRKLPNWRRA